MKKFAVIPIDKLAAIEWAGLTRSGHAFCVACGNVYETNMGKHLRSCWLRSALRDVKKSKLATPRGGE